MKIFSLYGILYHHFSAIQPRDQRSLILLGVFSCLVFMWLGIVRPIEKLREENAENYYLARSDFEWINAHVAEAKALPRQSASKPAVPGDGSLLVILTDSTKNYSITLNHATPSDDGTIHLAMEKVAFKSLLKWLEDIQTHYPISIKTISLSRITSFPGYVNASMVIESISVKPKNKP